MSKGGWTKRLKNLFGGSAEGDEKKKKDGEKWEKDGAGDDEVVWAFFDVHKEEGAGAVVKPATEKVEEGLLEDLIIQEEAPPDEEAEEVLEEEEEPEETFKEDNLFDASYLAD